MKKIIIALMVVALVAFAAPEKERTFKLTLTNAQAEALLYVIDKSNAEHNVVKQVQQVVIGQIQQQLADTTKRK